MNKKTEIRTRMAELHKEYAAKAAELKELEEFEGKAILRERYKEYLFKVFSEGSFPAEPKFEDVTDEDREHGNLSVRTGVAFSSGFNDGAYLLLKSKEEYPRIKLLYDRIEAYKKLEDKTMSVADKETQIKILLGESDV